MAESNFYVYEHIRNDINQPFYVGKGKNNRAYVEQHRTNFWSNIAKKHGYQIKIIAKNLQEELSFLAEIERIDQLSRLGLKLVNMTNGGEGISGFKHSHKSLKARALAQKGQKRPTVSAKLKGKKKSEEHKRKIAESKIGKKLPNEVRLKMSKTRTGKPSNMLGKKHSEESKLKTSIALKSKPKLLCPYCNKFFDAGNAKKSHFEKCKENK